MSKNGWKVFSVISGTLGFACGVASIVMTVYDEKKNMRDYQSRLHNLHEEIRYKEELIEQQAARTKTWRDMCYKAVKERNKYEVLLEVFAPEDLLDELKKEEP